jgi:hypothetical protein
MVSIDKKVMGCIEEVNLTQDLVVNLTLFTGYHYLVVKVCCHVCGFSFTNVYSFHYPGLLLL